MTGALTLQFIPYHEIGKLDSEGKISRVLDVVKENKIALIQGRLKATEETQLIQKTMEDIDKHFKGVELCTIYPEGKDEQWFNKIRKNLARVLLGDREGLTIIGPATLVKEIKRNPHKIELLTKQARKRSK